MAGIIPREKRLVRNAISLLLAAYWKMLVPLLQVRTTTVGQRVARLLGNSIPKPLCVKCLLADRRLLLMTVSVQNAVTIWKTENVPHAAIK